MFSDFKVKWSKDPILFETENSVGIKLFRIVKDEEDINREGERNRTDHIIPVEFNPKYIILPKLNEKLYKKYIRINDMKLSKELSSYLKLKKIDSEFISFTSLFDENQYRATIVNNFEFDNYLEHLNVAVKVRTKMNKIIRDRFTASDSTIKPDTSAILSNIGYLIKDKEGDYLSLSKGDRTFVKKFIFNQLSNGTYKLKVTESLQMFKEDIKHIIKIGEGLLKLSNDKRKIKSYSKKQLGAERSTLESAWQLYFDKYLRIFFMGYKSFYSQATFNPMPGYEKSTRPDFLAVDLYNNIDIIEIKHHRTRLFTKEKGRDSYYPSSDLNKSIFQLNKYLDLTSNLINTNQIKDELIKQLIDNEKIYRPRGVLIISSRDFITSVKTQDDVASRLEKEIKKLKTTYKNIEVILFDELIESLRKYLEDIELTIENNS